MRKLILILALTAVPFGIWTAGCQNDNRQAAFPNTPEMNALANNAGKDSAPSIPQKAIDRNILNLPENGTLARVQAANDRASQYAAEKAARGLFTLPEEKNYVSSAHAAPAAPARSENSPRDGSLVVPASAIPPPSAKEFWSKPVAARTGEAGGDVPADISAMAPPTIPAVPALPVLPALPAPQFPQSMPGKTQGGSSSLRPRAEITERAPFSPINPGSAQVSEVEGSGPIAAASPGTASPGSFAAFPPIPAGARIVSSAGLEGFEPLPEPIPLEQYNAMLRGEQAALPVKMEKRVEKRKAVVLPLPAALISSSGEAPGATETAVSAAPSPGSVGGTALAFGLAPAAPPMLASPVSVVQKEQAAKVMPKFAALEPTPTTSSLKGIAAASAPETLPASANAAAKADPVAFSPEKMDEAFAELSKSDFFKTDFWNPSAKSLVPAVAPPVPLAAQGSLPELTDPGEALVFVKPPETKQAELRPLKLEPEPEKVTLRPVRKIRAIPELEQIDSETEAPPLKF